MTTLATGKRTFEYLMRDLRSSDEGVEGSLRELRASKSREVGIPKTYTSLARRDCPCEIRHTPPNTDRHPGSLQGGDRIEKY
jgi:hypothetical protein